MTRMLSLAAAALVLAGCTKVGTQTETNARQNSWTQPHVLRYASGEDVPTLNPHLYSGFTLNFMTQMTMAYLVHYDRENKPIAELADPIPTLANGGISRDGKTITYHLRKGVKWSDGEPFDGDDVVFSFNQVNNLKNNEVGRDGFDLITKLDQPDKFTVVVHLKKPYSPFLPTFFGTGGANPCILPKHVLAGAADINNVPYNSKPIGIGPFRFVEWQRGDHVLMEANPYYFRGKPKLEKVIWKIIPDRNTLLTALQTGGIDLWPLVGSGFYDRVKVLPKVAVFKQTGFGFGHMDFNMKHPVVQELAVRHALRLATDRQTLRDKPGHGLGVLQEGVVSPTNLGYDPKIPFEKFDIAKANALLDAAGWKRGADGIRSKNGLRLALDFASTTGAPDTDIRIELLRGWWHQIGAELNRKNYQPSLLFATVQDGGILNTGKYDVALYSWYLGPVPDLSNLYECNQMPPNGQNSLFWCDREASAALQAFKAHYDPAMQQADDAKVQEAIVAQVPTIVTAIAEDIYAYNVDLKNYKPNSTSPFDNMMEVDI